MKLFVLLAMIGLIPASVWAQKTEPSSTTSGICGASEFVIQLKGETVGSETYNIVCTPDGYAVTATTAMDIADNKLDLASNLQTDAKSMPAKFTMKGNVFGKPVDQDLTFKDGGVVALNQGQPVTVNYTAGAALMPNNLSFPFQFIVNRFDRVKGGLQEIVLFPNVHATLELAQVDAPPSSATDKTTPTKLNRYLLQLGELKIYLWTDQSNRLLLVANPAQTFAAIRKEFVPYAGALVASVATRKLDYSAPAGAPFTAEEVTVQAKGHTLAGTLLLPKNAKGKLPAVITITGSGQQTRDEPLPLANLKGYRPFRQIAEALASHGIAVLRVDDRGVGDSTGLDGLANATTFDFADDTRAQVDYLRGRTEIDPNRVALLGHSEGGVIAPMVAASDPHIAAIVCLAGTGQRGDAVLLYQFNRAVEISPGLSDADRTAARAENAAMIKTTMEGGDTSKFPPILQPPWTRAFLNYDPLPVLRQVKQPILILQGSLDRQVVPENAELLRDTATKAGNQTVTVHLFPGLNHLFLPATTGDGTEYTTITVQEIPADVISTLTDWLVSTLRVK